MKDQCRIILIIVPHEDFRTFMVIALKMGLMDKKGYVFLTIDSKLMKSPRKLEEWNKYLGTEYSLDDMNRRLMNGVIAISTVVRPDRSDPNTPIFEKDIMRRVREEPFNWVGEKRPARLDFAVYLYDATILYARTVDRMLKNGTDINSPDFPDKFMVELEKTKFIGASDFVSLDEKGDRIPHYQIINTQNAEMKVIMDDIHIQDTEEVIWPPVVPIRFPDNSTFPETLPPDVPVCGFFEEKCPDIDEIERRNLIVMAVVAPIVVCAVIMALCAVYRPKLFVMKWK